MPRRLAVLKRPASAPLPSKVSEEKSSPLSTSRDCQDSDEDNSAYICYVLRSFGDRRTYTGITNNVGRRFRRHNGEIKGGAKATRAGRPWKIMCVIEGFASKRDALRFEWRAKRQRAVNSKKLIPMRGGLPCRCRNIYDVLDLERWTASCSPARESSLQITWYGGAPWNFPRGRLPAHVREHFIGADFAPGDEKSDVRDEGEEKIGYEPVRKFARLASTKLVSDETCSIPLSPGTDSNSSSTESSSSPVQLVSTVALPNAKPRELI